MRSSWLILALLAAAAACLAHAGTESTTAPAPRRSLTVDLSPPTDPRSDLDWCWDSLLTLGVWCKHDLLASFLAGRPAPRACCRAADEAVHHCGPFTRAFLGSILPLGPLAKCAHPVVTDAPATRRPRVPSGTPKRPPRSSVYIPPPEAPTPSASGTQGSPGPKPETTTRAPALPGGARDRNPLKPNVIAGGNAGGRARRAPDAYGAGARTPLAATGAAPPPQKGLPVQ
jgi:hypothetical protein